MSLTRVDATCIKLDSFAMYFGFEVSDPSNKVKLVLGFVICDLYFNTSLISCHDFFALPFWRSNLFL